MAKYYEIEWWGNPETTMRAAGERAGRAPRGGRHVRSREQAKDMLAAYLDRCGQYAGTVRAAHNPRIIAVE